MPITDQQKEVLKKIVGVLDKNNIPYEIGRRGVIAYKKIIARDTDLEDVQQIFEKLR